MTSLRGNLSTVDLANILQMLQMNQREGTLYITGAEGRRAIYFGLDGVSTLSRGGRRHGALGRILVRQGVISDDQLQEAVRRQTEGSARLIGQMLVEQGLVKREQIEEALRIQIEEEIYDLFITKDAQFEFVEGDVPEEFADPDGVNRIAVNVNSVIMEAAQRIDEWEWIKTVVPDHDEIFRYTGLNVPLDDDIFHEGASGRVLTAIDGTRSIEDLIETSYVERFDVCKIIALLLQGKALEPVPPEALMAEAERAITEGDTNSTIKFLLRLTQLRSETPETHRQLAEAYESESELERAAFHYRVFAETRVDAADVASAFRIYQRVFDMLPTDLAAADRMIELYATNSNGAEELAPQVIETGKMVAEVYVDLGRGGRAVHILHRIVALAPDDVELRTRLIDVYLAGGMTNEAIGEYEILAEAAMAREDYDRAERICRKILTIDSGRNDILRRLNQLISRKTRRRRSVRNSIAAAGMVTLLGVAGWYGIRFLMEQQADIERGNAKASSLVANLRDRHSGLAADLEDMVTRLASGRADEAAMLSSLQDNRNERESMQSHANQAVRDLMDVVEKHAGSDAATEARYIAEGYNRQLRELERLENEAIGRLAISAQKLYRDARALAENGASTRTQWAKFDEAMSIGAVCADWLASPDGTECQAFHLSLLEMLESLAATEEAVEELLREGDTDAAYERAISFLHQYPPPDLADELHVPIRLRSWPEGAAVTMDGEPTGLHTPATVLVPVRLGCEIELTSDGFEPSPIVFEGVVENDPKIAETRIPRTLSRRLQRRAKYASRRLPGRVEASPTVVGSLLIAPTRAGETTVLDLESGALSKGLELRNPSGAIAGAVASGDIVATPTVDGRIYFHRLSDRKLLGAYEAPGELRQTPVVHGGLLIAATASGRIVAVDLVTREERWRFPTSSGLPPARAGAPVLSGGELFTATVDGRIEVLDPSTGVVRRSFRLRTPDGAVELAHGIAVERNAVLAVTPRGLLIKSDPVSGDRLWQAPMEVRPVGPPLSNGARVTVVGEQGRVASVRLDNAEAVGHVDLEAAIVAPGALQGDALYVAAAGGRLLALDVGPAGTRLLWEHVVASEDGTPVEITTRPVIHEDATIFGTSDLRVRSVIR